MQQMQAVISGINEGGLHLSARHQPPPRERESQGEAVELEPMTEERSSPRSDANRISEGGSSLPSNRSRLGSLPQRVYEEHEESKVPIRLQAEVDGAQLERENEEAKKKDGEGGLNGDTPPTRESPSSTKRAVDVSQVPIESNKVIGVQMPSMLVPASSSKASKGQGSEKGEFARPSMRRWGSTAKRAVLANHTAKVMDGVSTDIKYYGFSKANPSVKAVGEDKRPRCMIHPESKFRRVWEIITMVALIYSAFAIPVRVSFADFDENLDVTDAAFWDGWTIVDLIVDTAFLLDVFLNFFTGYITESDCDDAFIEWSPKRVAKKYVLGWFLIDLVAALPFYLFINGDTSLASVNRIPRIARLPRIFKLFRLFRLVKLARISRGGAMLQKMSEWTSINPALVRTIKFLFSIVLVSHMMACFWYLTAALSDFNRATWVSRLLHEWACPPVDVMIEQGHIENVTCVANATDRYSFSTPHYYLISLYWSITTMSTIGYGDIYPVTTAEYVYTIVAMVVGVSLYAYTIGNISALIAHFDAHNTLIREKTENLNDFMRRKKLPSNLRRRLRRYFRYSWSKQGLPFNEQMLMSEVSLPELKDEIVTFLHGEVIKKVPFFKGKDANFTASIVSRLVPLRVSDGETIVRRGEVGRDVFFIVRGRVDVIQPGTDTVMMTYPEGSYFGDIAVFVTGMNIATHKAGVGSSVELYSLSKDDFLRVLSEHPMISKELRKVSYARLDKMKDAEEGDVLTNIDGISVDRRRRTSRGSYKLDEHNIQRITKKASMFVEEL